MAFSKSKSMFNYLMDIERERMESKFKENWDCRLHVMDVLFKFWVKI